MREKAVCMEQKSQPQQKPQQEQKPQATEQQHDFLAQRAGFIKQPIQVYIPRGA